MYVCVCVHVRVCVRTQDNVVSSGDGSSGGGGLLASAFRLNQNNEGLEHTHTRYGSHPHTLDAHTKRMPSAAHAVQTKNQLDESRAWWRAKRALCLCIERRRYAGAARLARMARTHALAAIRASACR